MPPRLKRLVGPYNGLGTKIKFARRMWLESVYHPEVRAFAEEQAGPGSRRIQAERLFGNIKRLCRYYADQVGFEATKAPWVMVQEIKARDYTGGDCDDQATLAYVLLKSIGIPSALRVAWYGTDEMPKHIYAMAHIDGAWLPFDTTKNKMGAESSYATVKDFE